MMGLNLVGIKGINCAIGWGATAKLSVALKLA
jgi:hypothetical protein